MAFNGDTILIKKDNVVIAAVKSHEVTTSIDVQQVSSPLNGQWKRFIPKHKEWSVNVNYLVPAVSNLSDVLLVGTMYAIVIYDRSNNISMTGTALLTTCKQTYTRGNLVTGTFQFQGSGPLHI